jgi:hypothetical protein
MDAELKTVNDELYGELDLEELEERLELDAKKCTCNGKTGTYS